MPQKKKRCLGGKLNAPFITFRIANVELIAKNQYAKVFCKYLRREVNLDLYESKHG